MTKIVYKHTYSTLKPSLRGKSGGFTLVEVLASVVLLSIGLLAILSAMQAGVGTQERANNLAIARNIAQGWIEQMRSRPFDSIVYESSIQVTDGSLPPGNLVSINATPVDVNSNLYHIKVMVRWLEGNSIETYRYETYYVRK